LASITIPQPDVSFGLQANLKISKIKVSLVVVPCRQRLPRWPKT